MGGKRILQVLSEIRKLQGRLVRTFLFYAFRCLPINPKKIVFCVFRGNGYGDNPKYIVEEIIRQNLDYDMVWLLRKENIGQQNLPPQVRPVRIDSLQGIYELVTAGVWVDNHLKPLYVRKRKNQCYIQTSHGLPCLKRLEFENYVELCKIEAEKIDVFLSNSSWTSSLILNGLYYNGEILECGAPRNDLFFKGNTGAHTRICEQYNIMPDMKIVLYAPTWRPQYDLSKYTFDTDMCLESLRKRFSGEWVFMVRHHPAVHEESLGLSGNACIVDVSQHSDMQELLAAVDVVVTDYSSLMFDFSIRRLPVFLYTPDIDAYRKERGFYFGEDELPFSFSRSNAQLAQHITQFNEKLYVKQVDSFFERIATCDSGKASNMVVDRIKVHLAQKHTTSNRSCSATSPAMGSRSAE